MFQYLIFKVKFATLRFFFQRNSASHVYLLCKRLYKFSTSTDSCPVPWGWSYIFKVLFYSIKPVVSTPWLFFLSLNNIQEASRDSSLSCLLACGYSTQQRSVEKNLCLSLPFLDCIVMFLFLSVRKSSAQMQVLVEEPHHVVRIFGNK